jgi:hypothetical protein
MTKEFLADGRSDLSPHVAFSTYSKLTLLFSVLIASAVRTPTGTRNATRKKAK